MEEIEYNYFYQSVFNVLYSAINHWTMEERHGNNFYTAVSS